MAQPPPPPPVAPTIGQSLAHVPRAVNWVLAILIQVMGPGAISLQLLYSFPGGPSFFFFAGVPWRLALALAWCAYFHLFFLVRSYVLLYLPRAPRGVLDDMFVLESAWAGRLFATGAMVCTVLGLQVEDTSVLAASTAVVAAFIVHLVAFWAKLARTYGGDGSEKEPEPAVSGTERTRSSSVVDWW